MSKDIFVKGMNRTQNIYVYEWLNAERSGPKSGVFIERVTGVSDLDLEITSVRPNGTILEVC